MYKELIMSDTPRTDDAEHECVDEPVMKLGSVDADFARQLERELNEANSIIKQQQLLEEENLALRQRIKRLEEGGGRITQAHDPWLYIEWQLIKGNSYE